MVDSVGSKNRKIELQQLAADADVWVTAATVWANIKAFQTAREIYAARQLQSEVTHQITIWYRRGLTAAWRARLLDVDQYRIWRIEAVNSPDEGMHRELVLLCVEEAAEPI